MEEVSIYEFKRMDLEGAICIDGFPSVGLVSTIAANYLISAMDLQQIGIVDSVHFPTVSVVRNSEPLNPVRIYGGIRNPGEEGGLKVVVFISEFQPPPNLIKMLASTILDWAQEQRCAMLISPEGLVIDRDDEEDDDEKEEGGDLLEKEPEIEPYGTGSTPEARKILQDHDIKMFEEGVISGVAGVLLNEGKRRNFNVITLLAEARPNYPDARAAARVIEAINKVVLHMDVDVKPLYEEAETIENKIRSMRKAAKPRPDIPPPSPSMYG